MLQDNNRLEDKVQQTVETSKPSQGSKDRGLEASANSIFESIRLGVAALIIATGVAYFSDHPPSPGLYNHTRGAHYSTFAVPSPRIDLEVKSVVLYPLESQRTDPYTLVSLPEENTVGRY